MRKILGRVLIGIAALFAAAFLFGPTEPVGPLPDAMVPPRESPEATVAPVLRAEALIPGIRENAAKEVIWARPDRARTPVSVIYVHGFSATREEIRPVPDDVAAALGANLFYARLAGHGRPGEAMGAARADHWMADMAEALAVGRALGERVLVIATSTGASLAALAALEEAGQRDVAGYVLISPNFGLQAPGSALLTLPFARGFTPVLLGETLSSPARSEAHAAAWTLSYPAEALVPMAAIAQRAYVSDHAWATAPALFILSDADQVVDPARGREVAARWGGGAKVLAVSPGPRDDPNAHVLAGRIRSPDLSPEVTAAILDWARARGLAPERPPAPAATAGAD